MVVLPFHVLTFSALLAALLLPSAQALPSRLRPPVVPDVVRGRVVLPDEGSPSGLYAYLVSPAQTDSAAVDATGGFSLDVGRAHCGALELRIDTPAGLERHYHPAVIRISSGARTASAERGRRADTLTDLRILLVPTRVVIDGGTYAGTVVPIHVDAALAADWERTRYWRVARTAGEGYGTPVAWPDGFFPLPVSLRAPGGVRSADSAAFWRTARQLEADLGRSLFQPVPDEPAPEELWRIVVTVAPIAGSGGTTFITYDSRGAIYEATVAIRSTAFLADAHLISHELMHALGFGHSSGWYSASSSGYASPSRVTPTDVGYAQLLYRLRRAHVTEDATHGILASSAEGRRMLSAGASRCGP